MASIIGTDAGETIRGTNATDTIRARGGNDRLLGQFGDDRLYGEAGDDSLVGAVGDDLMDGGAGTDTADYSASGGVSASLLAGSAVDSRGGRDTLVRIENLIGGAFNDTLVGDAGANRIVGGGGDDFLKGGRGSDVLEGGVYAEDTASWFDDGGTGPVTVNLLTGVAARGAERDALGGIENVTGTRWGDTLIGDGWVNILRGAAGDDVLLGQDHNDTLIGGFGDDLLDGGDGADRADYSGIAAPDAEGYGIRVDQDLVVHSVEGVDLLQGIEEVVGTRFADQIGDGRFVVSVTAFGGGGDDVLAGDRGDSTFDGGDGNDRLLGGGGSDLLRGGSGDDMIEGDRSDDLEGVSNDSLFGNGGADSLEGYAGSDRLDGGSGDDRLRGGADDDVMRGGAGRDLFVHRGSYAFSNFEDIFFTETGRDVITDFARGADRLEFHVDITPFPPELRSVDDDLVLSGFADLDSNANGVLDDGDQYVAVERVTFEGATRTSTVIDVGEFTGELEQIVVFGVTGLGSSDFIA
jgi:Ca2+-binding RTX toxin-like protein